MPRYWIFKINDSVVINENAKQSYPSAVGKKGKILELLEGVIYDYYVQLEDGSGSKFKESELNLYEGDGSMFKNNEKVIYKTTGEEARVNGYDLYNNQVGLFFDDGSYKVVSFSAVEKLNSDQIEDLSKSEFQEGDEVEISTSDEHNGTKGVVKGYGMESDEYLILINNEILRFKSHELKLIKRNKKFSLKDKLPNSIKLSNTDLHKQILDEMHDTYKRKNADYGNSFEEQFKEYGLLSAAIRLDDKMKRLKQLLKNEAKVKDESIEDTISDMSNYCVMTLMELRKQKERSE